MKSFNTSEKSLSDSSNSNEANSIKNENNNINLNLNYPLFLNKNDSDSFDDDEDSSQGKEEESLKNNNSVNQIVNEAQNKIIQQFVENNLFNLIGGNSKLDANDFNKSYLLDIFKHYPEEKMWCVTCLTKGGFTQDFTAFELFEFLCDKIKKNLDLDDYRIYHKDFQDIPQFGIIKFFNILSEFLDEYYQSSIFEQKNQFLKQEIEKQNNNQFNQYNQCNQNNNQNNNNNYEKINNWIHTNFNICNNNDNNF